MRNSSPASPALLSATADHALRAVLCIARTAGGRPMRADEIADATGAPRNYLAKTLNALAKAGVLRSARGPLGGFELAVPAHELTIARVVDVFAESPRSPRCLLGNAPCNSDEPCAAHVAWIALVAAARHPLVSTTVADLLGRQTITQPTSSAA